MQRRATHSRPSIGSLLLGALTLTLTLTVTLSGCSFGVDSGQGELGSLSGVAADGDSAGDVAPISEPAEELTAVDDDGDGVAAEYDCDDDNALIGELLFEEDFESPASDDFGYISTATLTDSWTLSDGTYSNDRGGQQARLTCDQHWTNTVTIARLSAHGLERKCRACNFGAAAALGSGGNGHALWMPGLYDGDTSHKVKLRFEDASRFHINKNDGSAALFGTAYVYDLDGSSGGSIGDTWTFEFHFAYRGQGAAGEGPDGPKIEQSGVQTPEVTDRWTYYDLVAGAMTRTADGALATITQRSTYPLQVGMTASGKNHNYGASVWLDFDVTWADGTITSGHGDINIDLNERDRFRAGILARAELDDDQDEGFRGYRCAVARNSQIDCHEPGRFVQIAEFMDAPEDDISSECDLDSCPANTTFDQLARVERSHGSDVLAGDAATLTFWVHSDQLVCEFTGDDGEHVVARASDSSLTGGSTGLSVLNALTDFEYVRVCEALGTP
ncbi:MAG: hypothetical protein AAGC55_14125 [Myxococcota bacterium]